MARDSGDEGIASTWRRMWPPIRKALNILLIVLIVYVLWVWLLGVPGGKTDPLTGQAATIHLNPIEAFRWFFAAFPLFLTAVIPLLLQGLALVAFIVIQFAAMFWFLSRGRTYVIYPKEFDVSFDDVRGQPAVVESTKEVLRLFRGYKSFRKVGGYPPHGILFEGPPGTGKTLLGKAIAGEAGVPFLYASATAFQNMFMGMSSMRIWSFFKKARKLADRYGGAVVFIDEIDAFGSRGAGVAAAKTMGRSGNWDGIMMGGMGMGGDRSMLNEILTQMDGMDANLVLRGPWRHVRRWFGMKPKQGSHHNVLVIGATNMASALDPALLRPGRFDRKIHVGNPTAEGRKDIITYYLDKVPHEQLDLDRFANATVGASPAEIKNMINEALIFARQEGRDRLGWEDIWQAILTEEVGLKEHVNYSDWEREATAIHEAGHAIAAWFLKPHQALQAITVQKRGATLGLTAYQDLEERLSNTRSEMMADITTSMGGMAAEQLWYGETTGGTYGDLRHATGLAMRMVGNIGMGSSLFSIAAVPDQMTADDAMRVFLAENDTFREEVDAILREAFEVVTELLHKKAHCVEALRDLLMRKDLVTGEEFEQLMASIGEGMRVVPGMGYRKPPRKLSNYTMPTQTYGPTGGVEYAGSTYAQPPSSLDAYAPPTSAESLPPAPPQAPPGLGGPPTPPASY